MGIAKEIVDINIPTTCNECFKSQFKKPKPECHYEKAYHLQKLSEFFKDELKLDLNIDVDMVLQQLHPLAQQCLSEIQVKAQSLIPLIKINELANLMNKMTTDIEKIKNNQVITPSDPESPIFRKEKNVESPVQDVKKPEIKIATKEKQPKSGWLKYQRNVKKENLEKFLNKLKKAHPQIADEVDLVIDGEKSELVKVRLNKTRKNYMIEYREI